MLNFNDFIQNGLTEFQFGDSIDNISKKLQHYQICPIDNDAGSFALFYNQIELLFDHHQLWLIQYEIDRIQNLTLNQHPIHKKTPIQQFKKHLNELQIGLTETKDFQQIILTTNHQVKLYFDLNSEYFLTAQQSWY
ncbi:unnamed protein product [Commensalibacter communis]|uniref:hypothetical protein n=1 Tax=Commensalibacter communis TaxID=2972786 RepID=UPI0022FFC149|nr:hypothetical protein [Commensalibacter communis]CAI3945383.1 unnamed protein product [Commensalibacter communis]CAI3946664.1 unnamed protein product [Commensalibacter communis]